ncbi:MAG: T9SS type A sorting domain-containing protein [Bacteroidetes bacterium]|nr:T9SS type A sorting domain-containing protein [Bacteroidota bacterium]
MSCFVVLGYSQYYYIPYINAGTNPGGLNTLEEQPFGQGLDASWTIIHEGGKSNPEWTPIINMPFLFYMNEQVAVQFRVSTSGVLSFDTNSNVIPPFQPENLPSANLPNKSVAVWGLSGKGVDDKIAMRTFDGPNKQLWISFINYGYNGGLPICNHFWSIVLEQNTNKIYIVDQKGSLISTCTPSLTLGIQMDNQTAIEVAGSPNISGDAGVDPSASDNSFYEFIPGDQPKQDVRAINLDVPGAVLLTDAPIVIKGDFISLGADELKSFDLNYTIDNGPVKTQHFSGAFPNLDQVEHNIPWIPTALGTYELKVWISNPNGQPDEKPADNELSANISVVEKVPPRLALIESFTQHNCGPCAAQNPSLTAVTHSNPHLVNTIKWVVTWPGANNDPRHHFNSPANVYRRNYYSVSGVPNTIVGGNVFNGQPGGVNLNMIQGENAKPNMVNFDISQTVSGSNLDISVDATIIKDPGISNLTLQVAVIQDELHYPTPTGSNGEKDFYDIMRYVIPAPQGSVLNSGVGSVTTASGQYFIDPIFYESFVHVSAWVQDDNTQEVFASGKNIGIYFCADGTAITPTPNITEASCAGNDGGVSLNIQGGSAPYNYAWSSGETTQIIMSKAAGDYTVTVTDASGCSFELPVRIPQKPQPNVVVSVDGATCNGDNDASITTYVAGGATPYTYNWSNGATTKDISNVAPGAYTLSVTDADGCSISQFVNVSEPGVLGASATMDSPDNGTNNGQATVEVTGGTHPYTYAWNTNPVQTTATAKDLIAGTYDVDITDYNGCTTTAQVTVDSNVGIEDLLKAGINSLNVYPNPSKGAFTVDVKLARMDDVAISIYDVNGRIAHRFTKSKVSMFAEQVNLQNVAAGIYTLKIQTSQGTGYHRIVLD